MTSDIIESQFKRKVSEEVRIESEGIDRYRVFTPFQFEDGDHLAIVLAKNGTSWYLTDEGHTLMHLSYEMDERDLEKGTRQRMLANALSSNGLEDRDGELAIRIRGEEYGDALFSFVQGLIRISDVTYLSRDRARSTFLEDFNAFLTEHVDADRREFEWRADQHDPQGMYTVDCRINGMPRPIFAYALPNDARTRDATIALHQFERWDVPFRAVAIFEEQETINRKVLARFSDVCDKLFSNLAGNRGRIEDFLRDAMELDHH